MSFFSWTSASKKILPISVLAKSSSMMLSGASGLRLTQNLSLGRTNPMKKYLSRVWVLPSIYSLFSNWLFGVSPWSKRSLKSWFRLS
ncbi:MAG: hypothetical protein Q7J72_04150 [Candidatus Omnitrophota bacterium]|nr:hypothetical protein [Candidatus Omnitrophota bacterium]